MKLLRLQLERFGHFQGASLDFSDGLQLLHGHNEAGKSTLLAALRALMFQFPRGLYDFRFPESTLAVWARLQFSDGALAEVRREKGKGWKGLVGPSAPPTEKLSDELFKQKLGHPSQELFANVFAFGLLELARGAESMEEAGLGAALSGAAVGAGVGPDALAAELKKQADELFLERGKKPINQLLSDIRERQKTLRDSALRGESFHALEDALAAERARAAELRLKREQLLRRAGLVESALRALPAKEALAGARQALERLGPVVALATNAESEFTRLAAERQRLAARVAELDGKRARAESERLALEAVEPAPPAVAVAGVAAVAAVTAVTANEARLAHLNEGWSGHRERLEQLEAARVDCERLAHETTRLRTRLDPPWSMELGAGPLPVPRVEELRRHKTLLDGLSRARESAERDRDRVARELRQAAEQSSQKAGEAPSPDELARLRAERDALWERIRKSWLEGALSGGEGSGPLFGRAGERGLAAAFVDAAAAVDRYADELRLRSTEVAMLAEAVSRHEERARALIAAERDLAQASEALAAGETAWQALWARCGFLPHSPDAMLQWLADHHALGEAAAQLESAGDREARLSAATSEYEASLRAALDGSDEPIERLHAKAKKLVAAEAEREQRRIRVAEQKRSLSRTLDDLSHEIGETRAALAAREAELAAWRKKAKVADDAAFAAAAAAAREAWELDREIAHAERTLAEARAGVVESELDEALARGRQLLDAEKTEGAAERARLESELQETDRRVGAAEVELRPFDGRSSTVEQLAALESRRAELRDRAGEWARVTVARALLERQMARFSAQQQPRLLERVSKLFAAMTGGRYRRVYQRLDEARSFVAVRDSGVEVTPAALSTGTREQLYLAVRLAYVDQYCAGAEPLPLVLDDVLVNFDDDRATATLAVLGQFAAEGRAQVLLLTCHSHLVALAKKVLPSLIPAELPPAG